MKPSVLYKHMKKQSDPTTKTIFDIHGEWNGMGGVAVIWPTPLAVNKVTLGHAATGIQLRLF